MLAYLLIGEIGVTGFPASSFVREAAWQQLTQSSIKIKATKNVLKKEDIGGLRLHCATTGPELVKLNKCSSLIALAANQKANRPVFELTPRSWTNF